MEHKSNEGEASLTGSLGRTSSSLRRRSLSLLQSLPFQTDEGIESESVSEAGDIGDRALHSNRTSLSGSRRFSLDHALESGIVFPIVEGNLLQPYGSRSRDSAALNVASPVSTLPEETISPLSTDAVLSSKETKHVRFTSFCLLSECLIWMIFCDSSCCCCAGSRERTDLVASIGVYFMSNVSGLFWDSWGNMLLLFPALFEDFGLVYTRNTKWCAKSRKHFQFLFLSQEF